MFASLLMTLAAGQYVESKEFPRAKQEQALAATAGLRVRETAAEGTAVVVQHKDGKLLLLTAAHNVRSGAIVDLELFDPKEYPKVAVKVAGYVRDVMPNEDLAVVEAPLVERPPGALTICPKSKLPTPERFPFAVLTVGCDGPRNTPTVQADTVLRKLIPDKGDGTSAVYWETSTAQAQGRSGGPLIDSRGYLMGICSGVQNKRGYYTYVMEIQRALTRAGYRELVEGVK